MSGPAAAGATIVLVALALAAGAGLGRWWGARRQVRDCPPLVALPLIGAGAALRLTLEVVPLPGAAALVVVSHALLLAACLKNLGRTGVPVVVLGLAVMLVPTVLDGGMPVSRAALATMGQPEPTAELPGGRHLEVDRDRLAALGDVIPLPLGGRPVSFGELIVLAGLADVAFHQSADAAARRRRRLGVLRSVPGGLGPSERGPWSDLDPVALDEDSTVVVLGPAPPGWSGDDATRDDDSQSGPGRRGGPATALRPSRRPTGPTAASPFRPADPIDTSVAPHGTADRDEPA